MNKGSRNVKLARSVCQTPGVLLFTPAFSISFFSCRRLCLNVYLVLYRRLRVTAAILHGGELPPANCILGQPFQTTALHLGEELA